MVEGGFEAMYSQTVDHALHRHGHGKRLNHRSAAQSGPGQISAGKRRAISGQPARPKLAADSGNCLKRTSRGSSFCRLRRLGQSRQRGRRARPALEFAEGPRPGPCGVHQDMGDRMQDIVVVTMSEFGRTAKENGNAAPTTATRIACSSWGGDVKAAKSTASARLNDHQLNEGRDLALTTDFRSSSSVKS